MVRDPHSLQSRRRTGRRYTIVLFIVFALLAGWAGAWKYAAGQAEAAVEGWRAREARAGRVYSCGAQSVGGFPFRIEVNCERASALLRGEQTPLEIRAPRRRGRGADVPAGPAGERIHRPAHHRGTGTIADHHGQLDLRPVHRHRHAARARERRADFRTPDGRPGQQWQDAKTCSAPSRSSCSGRIVEGSAADHPVVEVSLHAERASAPGLHPAAEPPIDADLKLVLRGLADYSPKPWPVRFRELQAAGGRIDIVKVRLRQGDTLAVGKGSLSLDGKGQLAGELRVTVAGLEPFLAAIGAGKAIQKSHGMDKLAGMLDRLAPGLGDAARQQAGANLGLGITMLGKPATLDGRQAVTLPLLLQGRHRLSRPDPARLNAGVVLILRRIRLRQRCVRQAGMRAAEIGHG